MTLKMHPINIFFSKLNPFNLELQNDVVRSRKKKRKLMNLWLFIAISQGIKG